MSGQTKGKVGPATTAPLNVAAGLKSADYAGEQGGAPSTSKWTRFNPDPEEVGEGEGDLDMQEQDRKRMQQGRKGRVNTDGYDSDSSVEGAGGGGDEEASESGSEDEGDDEEARRHGKVAGVDEDDEDMFNLQEDGKEGGGTAGKVKTKKYLEMKDIEGQEFEEGEDGDEAEGDPQFALETDEDEEEVRQRAEASRQKLHDPDAVVQPLPGKKGKRTVKGGDDMGFELDSFNVRNEMASGRFDQQGNYIENSTADPHAEQDQWLKGNYSRKSIKAAKEAQAKREKEARLRETEREKEFFDEDECKMRLVELMRRHETVLQALQRLGTEAKRAGVSIAKTKQWKRSAKSKQSTSTDQDARQGSTGAAESKDMESNDASSKIRRNLDVVTSMSSELMSRHGMTGIYDATYETIVADVRRSGLVRATWDPAAAHESESERGSEVHPTSAGDVSYLYKWSPQYLAALQTASADQAQPDPDHIFGPFKSDELRAWNDAGYFGEGGERILLCPETDSTASWRSWQDIFR